MRSLLLLCIFIMTGFTGFLVWQKLNELPPVINLPVNTQPIQTPEPVIAPQVILDFNQINSQIQNFDCSEVIVKTWEGGLRLKIHGSVSYDKPNLFRMKTKSFMGEETDIGSNTDIFWYWSRRDKNPGLYYSTYENYHKTRLKTPFNPVFLRESLGLEQVDYKSAKIVDKESQIMLTWVKPNAMGDKILYSMFIDKENKRMQGIAISSISGETLASCEVEYESNIPKKITYDWKEEKRFLVLEFINPKINQNLPSTNWDRPRYFPQINMGEE